MVAQALSPAQRGVPDLSGVFSPLDLAPLAWWRNSLAVDSAGFQPLDWAGQGRALSVGAAGARPAGYPLKCAFGAAPIFRMDSFRSTWAQAPGALTAWPKWTTADFTLIFEFNYASDFTSAFAAICTNGNGSSNNNGFLVGVRNTAQLYTALTSVTAGGTTHAEHTSPAAAAALFRPYDRVSLVVTRAGASWKVYALKRPRQRTDAEYIWDPAAQPIVGVIDPGAITLPLTLGAWANLSAFFDTDFSDVLVFDRALSNAERDQYIAWARTQYDFDWVQFRSEYPLTLADFADPLHPNNVGEHDKVGPGWYANHVALLAQMALRRRPVDFSYAGDSRCDGQAATDFAHTGRGALEALLATQPFTQTPVGPIVPSVYGGRGFCRSGMVERQTALIGAPSPGLSERTPNVASMDNWVGPAKPYNDLDILHIFNAINDLNVSLASGADQVYARSYERPYWIEFVREQIEAQAGRRLGVSVLTEPITPITIDGRLQWEIKNWDRETHCMARLWRAQGIPVEVSNLNDPAYPP